MDNGHRWALFENNAEGLKKVVSGLSEPFVLLEQCRGGSPGLLPEGQP